MKLLYIALGILLLIILFRSLIIESFRGRRGGYSSGSRRFWGGNRRGYSYGSYGGRRGYYGGYGPSIRLVYDTDYYDYPWYNPYRWFRPPCKKGCVHEGNGIWGCPYAGNGLEDCVFASDCQGC